MTITKRFLVNLLVVVAVVGMLFASAMHHGITPLHIAACYGNEAVVGTHLAAGAYKNAATQDGWTPLHLAA